MNQKIEKEDIFLKMIEARNTRVHTYNEDQAIKVYRQLYSFLDAFKQVLKNL